MDATDERNSCQARSMIHKDRLLSFVVFVIALCKLKKQSKTQTLQINNRPIKLCFFPALSLLFLFHKSAV